MECWLLEIVGDCPIIFGLYNKNDNFSQTDVPKHSVFEKISSFYDKNLENLIKNFS